MIKKFAEGLIFGFGFAISFVLIWFVASYLIYPMYIESKYEKTISDHLPKEIRARPLQTDISAELRVPFHEMDLEEQIKKSSIILLARYEPSTDGKVSAVITEFLKKDPDVTFYYDIGDEHPSSSYYPRENTTYGDGLVIFFVGSPAKMKMSMTYEDDRIRGLGDLPVELLKKKCEMPNA